MNINFNMQRNAYTAYGPNANEGCSGSASKEASEGKTFEDIDVGGGGIKSPFGDGPSFKGYGVDLDGDGKFSGDKDGVLAFDTNKDGKISAFEMQESNRILKALNSKDGGGGMNLMLGESKESLMAKYDRDKDGKVSTYELKAAGAMVVTDSNQDGQFHDEKAQAVDGVETASGKRALNGLNLDGRVSVGGASGGGGGGNWGWAQGSGRSGGGWG